VVRRAVREVLAGEDRGGAVRSRRLAEISVTFLARPAMQRMNRDWLGHDRPTDVLAFALPGPDQKLMGDMYICPAVARAQAREVGVPVREELLRLVVHGVLHLLGYDHPAGRTRTASPMWRRQERYVTVLA
jgi:probable rRNA maturation factor